MLAAIIHDHLPVDQDFRTVIGQREKFIRACDRNKNAARPFDAVIFLKISKLRARREACEVERIFLRHEHRLALPLAIMIISRSQSGLQRIIQEQQTCTDNEQRSTHKHFASEARDGATSEDIGMADSGERF